MIYPQVLAAGLAEGALIAAIAIGVVLTYRGSGVINFAHGAIAMYAAYIFSGLGQDGRYALPPLPNPLAVVEGIANSFFGADLDLPSWPTFVDLGAPSPGQSFIIALATVTALGLLFQLAVFKRLRNAPPLASTVASVGIFIALQATIVRRFGADVQPIKSMLPTDTANIFGVIVTVDRLILAGLTVVTAAVLGLVFARTRFGLQTRAVAENEKVSLLLGLSPNMLGGINWVLATLLAGTVGILASPSTGLDPSILPFLIVPALAAAVLGGLTSFTWAVVGGIGIAMAQSLISLFQSKTWWPRGATGVPVGGGRELIPLALVFVALVVRGRSIPTRGTATRLRMPRSPAPTHIMRSSLIALAILVPATLFVLTADWRQALVNSLLAAAICLSLVVVTGYVGQISLSQVALAGFSAFTLTKMSGSWGVPFPIAPLLSALAATALGVLIGLPAMRVRGVNLAIVTLAASVAIESAVFRNEFFTGGVSGVERLQLPEVFGFGFGPSDRFRDGKLPGPYFVVFVLVVVVGLFVMVANVRKSAWGRRFLAVRENERAAAAAGVNVTQTKLVAFGLAAFVAGIGGALSAYRFGNISPSTFGAFSSLMYLAFAYMGGIASLAGAAVAGAIANEGLVANFASSIADIDDLIFLLGGVGLVFTTVAHPEGIAGTAVHRGRLIKQKVLGHRAEHEEIGEGTAPPTGEPEPPRSAAPDELVGERR